MSAASWLKTFRRDSRLMLTVELALKDANVDFCFSTSQRLMRR